MEQATNQFNKGLQLDTHPMVQSNDTLSDCLNGTLITMNGNEVILQNDMGNRRVNNAYLPAGYQPVGIKEYGGVIYIAAYNPITNQSQIGSFPSPQKKFNDIDCNGELDFDYFLSEKNKFTEEFSFENGVIVQLDFIKSDTQFVLLTEDNSIYPGDKFVVYSNLLSSYKDNLTNYNNISDNGIQIESPKNRDYTLYLGVLNSQNEFVDITRSLQRWENNEIINFKKKYDYEVSEDFRFNSGYFIPDSFSNNELKETIQDANFIKARQALPVNTYGSKLIGPLYLKAEFNHVENFDYNIRGYKEVEGDIEYVYLTIEGFFTYNCPDQVNVNDKGKLFDLIYWNTTNNEINKNMKYGGFSSNIKLSDYNYLNEDVSSGNISGETIIDPADEDNRPRMKRAMGADGEEYYEQDTTQNKTVISSGNERYYFDPYDKQWYYESDNYNYDDVIERDGIIYKAKDEPDFTVEDDNKFYSDAVYYEDEYENRWYYTSKDNKNDGVVLFSINDNTTTDNNIVVFNCTEPSTPYTEQSTDNYDMQWSVFNNTHPIKFVITDSGWKMDAPDWSYHDATDPDTKLFLNSVSCIKILSTTMDKCIDTIEFEGEIEALRLSNGFGQQRKNTWYAGYASPRKVDFICNSAKLTAIKVRTRDISVKTTEMWNKHLQYSAESPGTGLSDFNFEKGVEQIQLYNEADRSETLYGNKMFEGSAILWFDKYKQIHYTSTIYDPQSAFAVLLYNKMQFTVEVPNKYTMSIIEIYATPGVKCISSTGTFENGVWKGRAKSVKFRYDQDYMNHGYLYRVIVHHDGLCGISNETKIKRILKDFQVLKNSQILKRVGNSVPRSDWRELIVIAEKAKHTDGFAPNLNQRTVEVLGTDENYYSQPIAYGHFEPYELKQSELDGISDGYTRNANDYYAIKLVYDAYTNDYERIIQQTPDVSFSIKKDAFGNSAFGRFILDSEGNKAEDCVTNDTQYGYIVNLN